MKTKSYRPSLLLFALLATPTLAGDEIVSIDFESIPGGTNLASGAQPIALQSDTEVTGSLNAVGEISSQTGFGFPDGTFQTTAAAASPGSSANAGTYGNTIADTTPPNAYTEICIKSGALMFDIHAASEPTAGGSCLPGDIGWLIERFERDGGTTMSWFAARLECLKDGMRLPEAFEWTVACADAALFAITDMEDEWEWTTNTASPLFVSGFQAVSASVFGNGSCGHASVGSIGNSSGTPGSWEYRCAR